MDGEGLFKLLPNEILSKILDYEGTMILRCASPSLETRVTSIKRAQLNGFCIKHINVRYIKETSQTLARAMAKKHAPEKLELSFCYGKFSLPMKQMLADHLKFITSLDIYIRGNEGLLMHPNVFFKSLESLTLSCLNNDAEFLFTRKKSLLFTEDAVNNGIKSACEAMVARHAKTLKHFNVQDLEKILHLPNLPVLHSLGFKKVAAKAALTLQVQYRQTITSLTIDQHPSSDDVYSADYKIPNLSYLKINCGGTLKLVLLNAEHLVCLDLNHVFGGMPRRNEYLEWPTLPNLRELRIVNTDQLLPLVTMSKDSLECLFLERNDGNARYDNDTYVFVELPKLKDLYIGGIPADLINKILRSNGKNLDLMFLWNVGNVLSNFDDSTRMMKMSKVLLKSFFIGGDYNDQQSDMLQRMCPNADVIIHRDKTRAVVRGLIKPRIKRKGFKLALDDCPFLFSNF